MNMESIAKGLVGHLVEVTMGGIRGTFERRGTITDVRGGIIIFKGQSGMEFPLPIEDRWMCVKSIRAILPEYDGVGTA